jgi:hypothetical protein
MRYEKPALELNQLSLFEDNNNILAPRADKLVMSQDALQHWKEKIFHYQQQVRYNQQPQQASLFDLAPVHCDLDSSGGDKRPQSQMCKGFGAKAPSRKSSAY